MKGKIMCVVVRENYREKGILYVPLLGGCLGCPRTPEQNMGTATGPL